MKIVFSTNTVALVGGVQQHFAAGEHDVTPDEEAQKLVDAGDASLPAGVTAEPTAAQQAAADAAEAQRQAEEAKAKAEAEAEAQAAAEAEANAKAESETKATAEVQPAAQTGKKGGGKK